LRADLGDTVRAERKKRRIKQEVLASDVGIRREALCRIENGRQKPGPRVLDALMRELEIDWNEVAEKGDTSHPARVFEECTRGRALQRLGNDICERRAAARLKLRGLSKRLRMSAAQLSRIERGQVLHSRIFRDHPDDLVHPREERRIQITDCRVRAFLRVRSTTSGRS
jgi:transcriptional regulator with XRE-family HTH domain